MRCPGSHRRLRHRRSRGARAKGRTALRRSAEGGLLVDARGGRRANAAASPATGLRSLERGERLLRLLRRPADGVDVGRARRPSTVAGQAVGESLADARAGAGVGPGTGGGACAATRAGVGVPGPRDLGAADRSGGIAHDRESGRGRGRPRFQRRDLEALVAARARARARAALSFARPARPHAGAAGPVAAREASAAAPPAAVDVAAAAAHAAPRPSLGPLAPQVARATRPLVGAPHDLPPLRLVEHHFPSPCPLSRRRRARGRARVVGGGLVGDAVAGVAAARAGAAREDRLPRQQRPRRRLAALDVGRVVPRVVARSPHAVVGPDDTAPLGGEERGVARAVAGVEPVLVQAVVEVDVRDGNERQGRRGDIRVALAPRLGAVVGPPARLPAAEKEAPSTAAVVVAPAAVGTTAGNLRLAPGRERGGRPGGQRERGVVRSVGNGVGGRGHAARFGAAEVRRRRRGQFFLEGQAVPGVPGAVTGAVPRRGALIGMRRSVSVCRAYG